MTNDQMYPNEGQEPETVFSDVQVYTGEPVPAPEAAPPSAPMMRSQTQYHTAMTVQKPRNLNSVVAAVMEEARHAKEHFYYSFPMGGKKVEGPSIGLAMSVARLWGNCAVPVEYYQTPTEWVFNAHFVDLEKGFTVSRVFRKKIGKGLFKKLDDERAEDMTFQAAQSRAIRNVVTAGVPRWLINDAIDAAKESVVKGITKEGVAHATERAVQFLAGYGVKPEQIEAVMGKPRGEWTPEDLATLRGMASQLKDGQITAEALFPPVEQPPTTKAETPKAATPDKKVTDKPSDTEGAAFNKTVTHPEVDPESPFELERSECWKLVVSRGVDLSEMERFTGVKSIEDITPDNLKNVLPYVKQWTPPKSGGRKK